MSMIDWSDPEEMVGLLCEYVADELASAGGDPSRRECLQEMRSELDALAAQIDSLSESRLIASLRAIHRSHTAVLAPDPVLSHVEDCIEELVRIQRDHSG